MSQLEQDAWLSLSSIFVPAILSTIIAVLFSLYKLHIEPRLPKNLQTMLDAETARVVKAIEQLSTGNEPMIDIGDRKAEAMTDLRTIFRSHKLPIPADTLLSDAIEAAVYLLPTTGVMGKATPIPPALAAQQIFTDPNPTMIRTTTATTNPANPTITASSPVITNAAPDRAAA